MSGEFEAKFGDDAGKRAFKIAHGLAGIVAGSAVSNESRFNKRDMVFGCFECVVGAREPSNTTADDGNIRLLVRREPMFGARAFQLLDPGRKAHD